MAFRFQKRVSLFPGVRLNFSTRGVSATFGVRGASVNVGGRGAYLNLGIPGSGISYRTKLNTTSSRGRQEAAPPGHSPASTNALYDDVITPNGPVPGEIRSASVDGITSAGLEELKRLINEAAIRRIELEQEITKTRERVAQAENRIAAAQRFLIRLFTRRKIPSLIDQLNNERGTLVDFENQLSRCVINLDFSFDQPITSAYSALVRAFNELRSCSAIWDITSSITTDQFRERTIAKNSIDRTRVTLDFAQSEIINVSQPALCFRNANGDDICIYPGFVMIQDKGSDFGLIELTDLSLTQKTTGFVEEESIPGDSEVAGNTWKKVNKDGSPDRRYSGNAQIPIVRYGQLWLSSPTGLHEAYMFSNPHKAESFSHAFARYVQQFSEFTKRAPTESNSDFDSVSAPTDIGTDDLQRDGNAVFSIKPPRLILDWIALVAIIVVSAVGAAGVALNYQRIFQAPAATVASSPSTSVTTSPIQPVSPSPTQNRGLQMPAAASVTREAATRPAPPVSSPTSNSLQVVFVQRTNVNVRNAPSMQATAVTSAPRAKQFRVFRREGDWTEVGEHAPIGWIHNSLLASSPPP